MSDTAQPEPVEPQEPLQEPAEPEPDTEPVPEPDEPAEPQEPPVEPVPEQETQARMEEIGKKLDGLQRHVAKRLTEILGDEAPHYEECDLCSYWNTPGWRYSGPIPNDLTEHLLRILNQRPPSDLKDDPHSTVCDECDGEGVVRTLSKVPGQTELSCVKCGTLGWLPTDTARKGHPSAALNGLQPASPPPAAEASAIPAPLPEDTPEIADLKARGYMVIPPLVAAP